LLINVSTLTPDFRQLAKEPPLSPDAYLKCWRNAGEPMSPVAVAVAAHKKKD
jgi:hypothetical protein